MPISRPKRIATYDDLNEAMKDHANVLSVEMSVLRDLQGAGRLGPYVVEQISRELARRGLGHFPEELPQSQWEQVRIYKKGSDIADVIDAVTKPGEDEDEKLRKFASDDARDILNKIRQILC